jgi:hypothetical protein
VFEAAVHFGWNTRFNIPVHACLVTIVKRTEADGHS